MATVMVVLLNALFHVGASRKQNIQLAPKPESIDSPCELIETSPRNGVHAARSWLAR